MNAAVEIHRWIRAAEAARVTCVNKPKFDALIFFHRQRLEALGSNDSGPLLDQCESAMTNQDSVNILKKEVADFSNHCVFIRSVYRFMLRLFRDSDETERAIMNGIAPLFFEDLSNVLREYVVIAACRITDPAVDKKGNEGFTIEMFLKQFAANTEAFKTLDALWQQMKIFRAKIVTARNKLAAHTDRVAVTGPPLGAAGWKEWDQFWSSLEEFVRTLNEQTIGTPFEIDAGGVLGDAEMLLKALIQSKHFEVLLREGNPVVKAACLKVAST